MVGAVDVGMDGGALYALYEFARDEEVVNAPSLVPVARADPHIPIAVCVFGMRVEVAE